MPTPIASYFYSYIISFILGIFASLVATFAFPEIRLWVNNRLGKYKYIFDTHFRIIHNHISPKIYNGIVLLNITENEFSVISNNFMRHPKHKGICIITNTKEPWWFYEKFREYVFHEMHGNNNAAKLLVQLESNMSNLKEAEKIVKKLRNLFYKKNTKIKIFPHLRSIYNLKWDSQEKVRINFLDLNLGARKSEKEFKKRNKYHEVFFFENLINNKRVKSVYQYNHTFPFPGTDALILGESIILNHDDSINELNYQKNSLVHRTTSGFFHTVLRDYKENKFQLSSEILEIYKKKKSTKIK